MPGAGPVFSVRLDDPGYPGRLRAIAAAPSELFVLGALPSGPAVAVVGSRRPTAFGRELGALAARAAVRAGFAVVSGLAPGVDTAAHEAALACGGRTFAVVASGVDVPGRADPHGLAGRIVAAGGGLVAEVAPGTGTSARRRIARDRLQAGLSEAVVVCESELGGGALHTARTAVVEGRRLVVVRPGGRAAAAAAAGVLALCDPAGCDPAVLSATGHDAACVAARRPVADTVLERREELPEFFADLYAATSWPP